MTEPIHVEKSLEAAKSTHQLLVIAYGAIAFFVLSPSQAYRVYQALGELEDVAATYEQSRFVDYIRSQWDQERQRSQVEQLKRSFRNLAHCDTRFTLVPSCRLPQSTWTVREWIVFANNKHEGTITPLVDVDVLNTLAEAEERRSDRKGKLEAVRVGLFSMPDRPEESCSPMTPSTNRVGPIEVQLVYAEKPGASVTHWRTVTTKGDYITIEGALFRGYQNTFSRRPRATFLAEAAKFPEISDKTLLQAEAILSDKLQSAQQSLSIFGATISANFLVWAAPLVTLVLTLYLLSHVVHSYRVAQPGLGEVAKSVPWIVLFPGVIPRTMTILSIPLAPLALNVFILYRFFGEFVPWDYGALYLLCSLVTFVAGLMIIDYVERLRSDKQRPFRSHR